MKSASQLLLLAALALPVTGCNDPLNVQDPDVVPPGNLNNKSVLPTIRAGAIGDFALAYTGSGADGSGGTVEGVTMYGGLLADEWINSETFPTRIEVDSRGPIQKTNADVGLWYRNLHRARRAAEFAAERLDAVTPGIVQERLPEHRVAQCPVEFLDRVRPQALRRRLVALGVDDRHLLHHLGEELVRGQL